MKDNSGDQEWLKAVMKKYRADLFPQKMASWTLGQGIRWRRKKMRMTLQELADKADTSKGYLWEIENKGKNPSVFLVQRIAYCLGINIDDLLGKGEG